jgi:hypothetical protein
MDTSSLDKGESSARGKRKQPQNDYYEFLFDNDYVKR